jgi:hypothetical protein
LPTSASEHCALTALRVARCAGGWAELLPFVYKLCIDASAAHKKLGLELLASLSLEVGHEAIVPLLEPLQPVFSEALNAPNPTAVRVACVKAVASTVPHIVDKEHRAKQQAMQAHLPACFAILNEALAAGDMTNARECLSSFIDITSSDAAFLRPHVDTLLSTAFAVAGGNVDENVRHLGLELMVTFAECKPVCRPPCPPSPANPPLCTSTEVARSPSSNSCA